MLVVVVVVDLIIFERFGVVCIVFILDGLDEVVVEIIHYGIVMIVGLGDEDFGDDFDLMLS